MCGGIRDHAHTPPGKRSAVVRLQYTERYTVAMAKKCWWNDGGWRCDAAEDAAAAG